MAEKSSRNGAVLALKPPVAPRLPARWEDSVATVAVRGEVDREASVLDPVFARSLANPSF